MKRTVIDNFLPESIFKEFQQHVTGDFFPWYKNDSLVFPNDGEFQFTHVWFRDYSWNSDPTHILPVINFINPLAISRIKVNCRPPSLKIKENTFHIDVPNLTTMILYINSNDGYTLFKDGLKVESIENRAVIFDSNLEHAGTSSTGWRHVLNINYVESIEEK
jgi:hypothetical protein